MTRLCAWCNKDFRSPEHHGRSRQRVLPQLCPACSESMVFQMGVPFQKFIDSLPAPIFVVDSDAVVQTANKLGLILLNKRPEQIEKKLGGVVFECAYARLPEGCGRTVHCSGCAIRRSVYHTFETGESLIEVPATLQFAGRGEPQHIDMLISTEKMGEVVVLRVDRMCAPAATC